LYKGTAALFQNLRSLICFHSRPSSVIAFSHSDFSLSRETPSIVKFLFLYFLYAATTLGFSSLHGPHQLAQKSTNTYLPFNELNENILPSVSGIVISGAGIFFSATGGLFFGLYFLI